MRKQNELNIKGAIYFDGAYWRAIDCDGFYLISTDGRIWSVERKHYLKPMRLHGTNYRYIKVTVNGRRKNLFVHRLVAIAFLENPKGLAQVNHKDENPENNDVFNLEWISQGDNLRYGTRADRMSLTCKLKKALKR